MMRNAIMAGAFGIMMAFAVAAAEPTPAKPEAPATASKPAEASKSPADEKDPQAASAKPGDAKAAGKDKDAKDSKTPATPQRFVPSEQVRPDFDVSFPVDI